MTASLRGPAGALLLRAGYLLVALALTAGILGMHIMTGAHSMAATHTTPAAAAAGAPARRADRPAARGLTRGAPGPLARSRGLHGDRVRVVASDAPTDAADPATSKELPAKFD